MQNIKYTIQKFVGRHINWLCGRAGKKNRKGEVKLGLICEEFFHEQLRGFGGFGMTLKYITEHFNSNGSSLRAMVCLATPQDIPVPVVEHYHNAPVLLPSAAPKGYVRNFLRYGQLLSRQGVGAFVTVEYYSSYEYTLEHITSLPWIIWLKDPRDQREWEKIATVDLERKVTLQGSFDTQRRIMEDRRSSLHRMLEISRRNNRRVYVATESPDFIPIAERLYDISIPKFTKLPKPMPLKVQRDTVFEGKPSLLFLARLDPVKRPWVYFELAKRMPEYTFYVAGKTHFPEVMNPIIEKYRDVPNLIFLGNIHGEQKDEMLRKAWAMVNTSIHEALPCSFIETYSYGKPVISCSVNTESLTERLGAYTGEILGNADDEESLQKFETAIRKLLTDKELLQKKSKAAAEYFANTHSFEVYRRNIQDILSSERCLV